MTAGASARREYEKRLIRHKELVRKTIPLLLLVLAVVVPVAILIGGRLAPGTGPLWGLVAAMFVTKELWPYRGHVDAWGIGAAGESKVGRRLEKLPSDYKVFHDRKIPGSKANIDHIVVGPTGVFAIETKNVAGKVALVNGELRVAGRRKAFGEQAWREAVAVQGVLAPVLVSLALDVKPILCFTKADLPSGSPKTEGVPLLYPKGAVRAIKSGQPRLSAEQVARLSSMVEQLLAPA